MFLSCSCICPLFSFILFSPLTCDSSVELFLRRCKTLWSCVDTNKTNRNMVSCFSCCDIIGVPGTCLLPVEIQAVPMTPIVPGRCYLTSLL